MIALDGMYINLGELKMTICKLPIKEDMGKFYLKRMFWKTAIAVIYIFFFIILFTPLTIVLAQKYGSDSKEMSILYTVMFLFLIISLICYAIWLRTSCFEEFCVQYIFVITCPNTLWVINCCDPVLQSIFTNPRSDIMSNLGFYGFIYSLGRRPRYILDHAWRLSYASDLDIVGYFTENFYKIAHTPQIGQPIYNVSDLKVHNNCITFKAKQLSFDSKIRQYNYRISTKFTYCDELIRVLRILSN
ncbi:MAG TPA: hypothetical protein PK033_11255 [Acetivibrio sp.]|nr:hypothetical protein [Acetivibrio sp.]